MNSSAEEIAILRSLLEQQTALALIHYDTAQKLTAVVEKQSLVTEGLLAMVQELVTLIRRS